ALRCSTQTMDRIDPAGGLGADSWNPFGVRIGWAANALRSADARQPCSVVGCAARSWILTWNPFRVGFARSQWLVRSDEVLAAWSGRSVAAWNADLSCCWQTAVL